MRGLAALSVVFLHATDMFFTSRMRPELPHQGLWLLLLRPFYLGHEAVILFFALSGFVLTLPIKGGRSQTYSVFLTRRVLRIYGPYLIALGFAVAGAAIWHGRLHLTYWAANMWSTPIDPWMVLKHVLFIGNYDSAQYNVVFWSLVVEMRVSIVFPFLAAAVLRVGSLYSVAFSVLCLLLESALQHYSGSSSRYLIYYFPSFIGGILLAKHLDQVVDWYAAQGRGVHTFLKVVVLCCYAGGGALAKFSMPVVLLGSLGIMALSITSDSVRGVLGLRFPQFLGRISYSLYLVHVPILFALVASFHDRLGRFAIFCIYVPAAILAGEVFNRFVEQPFTRLSHTMTAKKGATR